jgi:K+-transporting ATPase KdpF subunit
MIFIKFLCFTIELHIEYLFIEMYFYPVRKRKEGAMYLNLTICLVFLLIVYLVVVIIFPEKF